MAVDLSIVIPVFNGERTLEQLHKGITLALEGLGLVYEVIMVDDNSSDNSFALVERIQQGNCRVKGISLAENAGQQNAILCGFHYAKGRVLITMDDDLQHPPQEIENLLDRIQGGNDLVFGVPSEKKHPLYRNLGTKIIDKVFNLIGLKGPALRISSFRAFKREVLPADLDSIRGFVYISALLLQGSRRPTNALVRHDERRYGQSNYNLCKLGVLLSNVISHYYLFPRIYSRNLRKGKRNFVIKKNYCEDLL